MVENKRKKDEEGEVPRKKATHHVGLGGFEEDGVVGRKVSTIEDGQVEQSRG